jgi:hypothetical protein
VRDALLNVALVVVVLGGAAVFTHLFTKAMYLRCAGCGTLNARRRTACRRCGKPFQAVSS